MSGQDFKVWAGWSEPVQQLKKRIARLEKNSPTGEKRRELDRAQIRYRIYKSALNRLQEYNSELYRGEPGIELSDDESGELIHVVCSTRTGYKMRDVHRLLIRGLERGKKELGWRLQLPAPLTVNITEASNISPEVGERIDQFDTLEMAFWEELESCGPTLDTVAIELDAGRLLYSIMAHSGFVNLKLFEYLPKAIQAGAGVHGQIVWLDLEKDEADEQKILLRRFFPSPITQILLFRWYRRWGSKWPIIKAKPDEKNVYFKHLLKPYVRRLCSMSGLPDGVAQNISSIAQADLGMKVPTSLLHILRSSMLGVPVPAENWYRLLTGQQGLFEASCELDEKDAVKQPVKIKLVSEFPDQHPLLQQINDTIRSVKAKSIASELERSIQRKCVSPILQLMGHWAIELARYGGRKKDRLLADTIATYLSRISPLLDHADTFSDPFLLDADSWQDVYDNILGRSHGKATSNRISALSDFHQFLERTYGVPPVDIGGIGGQGRVDARLLSPTEYYRVRAVLQVKANTDRWALIQELVLILGYRCGLRRNEALGRLFADFAGIDDPLFHDVQLLVRPNKNGRIKTEAGTRTLPLHILLTDEELGRLERFCAEQRQLISGAPGMRSVFAEETGGYRAMPQAQIFDPLTRVLNEVTGDGTFRFHHLRHSFVSLIFLRLIENCPGEHIPAEWRQDEEGNNCLPSMDVPLWQKLRLSGPGQALWEVGMLTGHASPSISLHSYSHLVDWLARSFLWRRNNPDLYVREQAALLGRSVAAVEKFRQRQELPGDHRLASHLADKLAENWPLVGLRVLPELRNYVPTELSDSYVPEPHQTIMYRDAYELMLAMETIVPVGGGETAPRGLRAAAELMEIGYDTALKWHCNAINAMALRTRRERNPLDPSPAPPRSNRSRLSTERDEVRRSIEDKDHRKGDVELQSFISPPKTPDTKSFAKKYFVRLVQWYQEQPQLATETFWMILESSQRSSGDIVIKDIPGQKKYFEMLCQMRLRSRVTIRIRVTEEMTKREKEVVDYWVTRFNTDRDRIRLEATEQDLRLGLFGKSRVLVQPPPELYKKQNLFWSVLRFVVLSAYVVSAEPSDDDWEFYWNDAGHQPLAP